jgi:hypothetical protein
LKNDGLAGVALTPDNQVIHTSRLGMRESLTMAGADAGIRTTLLTPQRR